MIASPHQPADIEHTDIRTGDWVGRYLPAVVRPYARLARIDRPIGSWLLLFPCWWSLALASGGRPDLWLMSLFLAGAVVMRGAGCTINDILDRRLDANVERTRHRPLPSGQISVKAAVVFAAVQMLLGFIILIAFNWPTILTGAASLVLVFVYPLMKRITFWPQAVLGLAFNWGALLGWSAVHGHIAPPAMVLYGAGILWTLGYDTIYAHQDKRDDTKVGIGSTAICLGQNSRLAIALFYAGMMGLVWLAGQMAGFGSWLPLALLPAAAHLWWQVAGWAPDNPADCLYRFQASRWTGWLILAGLCAAGSGLDSQ